MIHALGLYRERSHSPGRIDDDAAIMQAVAGMLPRHGIDAALMTADPAAPLPLDGVAGVFAMCEQEMVLRRLDRAVQAGVTVVNPPAAIRNTYRVSTATLFRQAGVAAPATWVVETDPDQPQPAPALWVKRADFHATEADDVVFVDTGADWRAALTRFAARGMPHVVVQAHVPGDLIKFYGVAGAPGARGWFHWFYHADQRLAGHAFALDHLHKAAFAAAAALGVEIFGGDAIVGPDGRAFVIDLNAWPSFARCRAAAATAIAAHLARRFVQAAPAVRLSLAR